MSTIKSHFRVVNSSAARIKKYCAQSGILFMKYHTTLPDEFIHCSGWHAGRELSFFIMSGPLLEQYGMKDARFSAHLAGDKLLMALYSELIASRKIGAEWFVEALDAITIKDLHFHPQSQYALYSAGDDINFIWFAEESLSSLVITDKENNVDWSELACPVRVVLGRTCLCINDIHQLAIGDVITLRTPDEIFYVTDRPLYTVLNDQHSFTIGDKIMTDNTVTKTTNKVWMGDELTFNVEFVLAQTSMTLAQISRLQPGDILGTEIGINENKVLVKLCIQNKTIASGELILLDECLAVEIDQVCYGS
ncbi:FliM/FliN family flagellar motor switch protein [Escherichia albertii]|uniref:FliM/FliN family flagellar motor switch protein n=1 Tax=Escherichia albertii TaxID=208962 RepID=UPI0010F4F952|nr:FliM/FliN family flagellar motor switch protein [Escherichia albertii]MCZ8687421.1 FliM/FliN family flagellar motor switch protein [Escherichia albertii]MCZ8730146.1 FliM/FliN family flagellar motor switch protein [Escherichia albertii]MCZ8882244.1 FliM/FliN family flagellar motor switch protein [Escherichia albertii]MCZ8894758.1 FliM/FliN family flagellar motor switch protein [Escherichia albertii]